MASHTQCVELLTAVHGRPDPLQHPVVFRAHVLTRFGLFEPRQQNLPFRLAQHLTVLNLRQQCVIRLFTRWSQVIKQGVCVKVRNRRFTAQHTLNLILGAVMKGLNQGVWMANNTTTHPSAITGLLTRKLHSH